MSNSRFFRAPAAPVEEAPAAPAPLPGDGAVGSPPASVQEGGGAGAAAGADATEAVPSAPAPAAPAAPAVQAHAFAHVQDRVVQALLRKGAIRPEQVTEAEEQRRIQQSKAPLWRMLAELTSVDRDVVYEQAAVTYAFRIAPVKEREPEAEFVKTVLESFSEAHREKLLELKVAPYAYAQDQPSGILKLVFITEDPMRPELQRTMHALELERFELCYRSEEHT